MSEQANLFDRSKEYDDMLHKGLSVTGEDKYYFIHGRLKDLQKQLAGKKIERILDFGCGIGDSTIIINEYFPEAQLTGVDTAAMAVDYANENNNLDGAATYKTVAAFNDEDKFDLCFVNGVFHHIDPKKRVDALKLILRSLKKGGQIALFENNPLNPGTRIVMKRIPFDADAIVLKPSETRKIIKEAGFSIVISTRFLFYFPRALSFMRWSEKAFVKVPMGGQYYVLAEK